MAVHDDKKSAHPAQSAVSEAAAKQGFSERPAPPPPGSEEIARREKAAEAAMKAATARPQGSEELSSYLGFFRLRGHQRHAVERGSSRWRAREQPACP
mmetsp:Transcript_74826/g.124224  ORF Transcript_74826/g.124224 Transcript_74826/m.124224 type:complete len:98 (-) Transcript_74826:509-802(-)